MANPVKRFTTTRSVVAARAAEPEKPAAARLTRARPANSAIKAIPGRKPFRGRDPFLSCRCAVIVDADKIRVGDTGWKPRGVPAGITLRPRRISIRRGSFMTFATRLAAVALAALMGWAVPASAQQAAPYQQPQAAPYQQPQQAPAYQESQQAPPPEAPPMR